MLRCCPTHSFGPKVIVFWPFFLWGIFSWVLLFFAHWMHRCQRHGVPKCAEVSRWCARVYQLIRVTLIQKTALCWFPLTPTKKLLFRGIDDWQLVSFYVRKAVHSDTVTLCIQPLFPCAVNILSVGPSEQHPRWISCHLNSFHLFFSAISFRSNKC